MPREAAETLSPEAFAMRLRTVIGELSDVARSLAPLADVRVDEVDNYWRLTLVPHAANACPLDLFLRADRQVDIAIGAETAEDLPAGDLTLFPKLVAAIVAGRVVLRRHRSVVTGALLAVETRVSLLDGVLWRTERATDLGRALTGAARLYDDHYVLPYSEGISPADAA